jgi:hypothetical protein
MNSVYKYSSLYRPLDFNYFSNIFIVGLSLISGIITIIVYPSSIAFAAVMVINVFFVWDVCRSLAPINSWIASVAATLSIGIGLYLFEFGYQSSPLSLFVMMILIRMVTQPAGVTTTLGDAFFLPLVAFLGTQVSHNTLWLVIASIAFFLDWNLKKKSKYTLISIVISLGGILGIMMTQEIIWYSSTLEVIVWVVLGLLITIYSAFLLFWEVRVIQTDTENGFINPRRLFFGRLIAGLCIMSLYFEIFVYG